MKNIHLFLLITFLLSSCAPAATQTLATTTFTEIPTQTSTPILSNTPTPTSTLTPTITPTPLPISFVYQDDVPTNGRVIQEQAAYKAYAHYSQYADLGSITIYTFSDINQYIDQIFPALQSDVPTLNKSQFVRDWIAGGGGNTGAKDIVVISSDFLPWKDDANLCYKSKNVAHELFHTLQSRLMHHGLFRPALDYGPEWLKEGSAEVMGNQIADGLNNCSYQQTLGSWIEDSSDKTFSLKQVEGGNFGAKVGFWSVAPLAVDHLIKGAPNGEKALIDYYSEIGNGKNWRDAFKLAFGMPIEEYYTDFGAFQQTIKVTLDTSVCLPQSDQRVKCLGRKPYNTNWYRYIFSIPFAVKTQPQEWVVEPTCALAGYGANGSDIANNLLVDVDKDARGSCHVKFTFSENQEVIVDFEVSQVASGVTVTSTATPYPNSDTSVCLPQTDSRVKCLGLVNNNGSDDYTFEVPFDGNTLPSTDRWKSSGNCLVTGWGGTPKTSTTFELAISFDADTHGTCHINIIFSSDKQIPVDLVIP